MNEEKAEIIVEFVIMGLSNMEQVYRGAGNTEGADDCRRRIDVLKSTEKESFDIEYPE